MACKVRRCFSTKVCHRSQGIAGSFFCPASLQFVLWLAASASKVQGSAASSHQRRFDHLESARSNSSTRFLSGKSSKLVNVMWRSCLGFLENMNYPNLLKDAKSIQKHLHVHQYTPYTHPTHLPQLQLLCPPSHGTACATKRRATPRGSWASAYPRASSTSSTKLSVMGKDSFHLMSLSGLGTYGIWAVSRQTKITQPQLRSQI